MTGRRGFIFLALFACATSGCSHFSEGRAIAAFTSALVAGDMQELKDVTSDDFKEKALRRSEALDDLQVLRLPEEPPAIVEVKDVSDVEKQVTVTEPGGSSKLLYKLVVDDETGRWVVDDIFTKQQKSGVTVSKPVTEQMDLLLTIRDFLEVWDEDDRESVLAITTPEFSAILEELPAPWLARLTQQIVGGRHANRSQRQHKPQVAIDGDTAVVRLPRTEGTLQISLKMHDADWKVDDASILTRKEELQIRSVKNRARIIYAATSFVEAFRMNDRGTLVRVSTSDLYEKVLKGADLTSAKIPDIMLAPQHYELKATVDKATILIPTPASVVKLELNRIGADTPDATYQVSDLSLYDSSGKNKMRLSAFFTATNQVKAFHQALIRSDRKGLGRLSSRDFDKRVWSMAEGLPIQLLPTGAATGPILKTAAPESHGSLTHVQVQHREGLATYVLINAEGRLVIDDVMLGSGDRQRSLRTSLELAMPILAFATAVDSNRIPDIQRVCSDDFNRLVWSRAKSIPDVQSPILSQLTKPIRSMRTQPGRAIVELGDPTSGAVVKLETDNQHWVIDDIEIISDTSTVRLKSTMRDQMVADLKSLKHIPTVAQSPPTRQAQTNRKRFDLRRPEGSPRKTLAMTPSPSLAENATGQVAQVALEPGATDDSSVQHAVMFAPMEVADKQPAHSAVPKQNSAPEPRIISPAEDAVPIESAADAKDSVDLDALFAAVEVPSKTMPTTVRKAPQVSQEIQTNDTGRVTDPALQPIRIPR